MKELRLIVLVLIGAALALHASKAQAAAADTNSSPNFPEVYGLIRSNLTGVSEAELNRAAVAGLLKELQTGVILVTNNSESNATTGDSLVSKTEVYDGAYGYLRVRAVGSGLEKNVSHAIHELVAKKKLNGLVLDLRFANGQDYAAAAAAADLFLANEKPLIKVGETMAKSMAKTNAFVQPLAVLVNRETAGAAEALAAVLRQSEAALVIGTPTAGQAHQFKEFTLSNGQRLRIASGSIQLGNGATLTDFGLIPDIRVEVSLNDERIYFKDAYKAIPTPLTQALRPARADSGTGNSTTNRPPRRRINESELQRLRRDGNDPEAELPPPEANEQPAVAVMHDPALARALDFLKGLALVQSRRGIPD